MKLIDLFPQFLRVREMTMDEIDEYGIIGPPPHHLFEPVDDLSVADGIRFTDPLWAQTHPGEDGFDVGASVHVAFQGRDPLGLISIGSDGRPTRWTVSGIGYGDLRLSPSIFVNPHGSPPGWHGFIGQSIPGEVANA